MSYRDRWPRSPPSRQNSQSFTANSHLGHQDRGRSRSAERRDSRYTGRRDGVAFNSTGRHAGMASSSAQRPERTASNSTERRDIPTPTTPSHPQLRRPPDPSRPQSSPIPGQPTQPPSSNSRSSNGRPLSNHDSRPTTSPTAKQHPSTSAPDMTRPDPKTANPPKPNVLGQNSTDREKDSNSRLTNHQESVPPPTHQERQPVALPLKVATTDANRKQASMPHPSKQSQDPVQTASAGPASAASPSEGLHISLSPKTESTVTSVRDPRLAARRGPAGASSPTVIYQPSPLGSHPPTPVITGASSELEGPTLDRMTELFDAIAEETSATRSLLEAERVLDKRTHEEARFLSRIRQSGSTSRSGPMPVLDALRAESTRAKDAVLSLRDARNTLVRALISAVRDAMNRREEDDPITRSDFDRLAKAFEEEQVKRQSERVASLQIQIAAGKVATQRLEGKMEKAQSNEAEIASLQASFASLQSDVQTVRDKAAQPNIQLPEGMDALLKSIENSLQALKKRVNQQADQQHSQHEGMAVLSKTVKDAEAALEASRSDTQASRLDITAATQGNVDRLDRLEKALGHNPAGVIGESYLSITREDIESLRTDFKALKTEQEEQKSSHPSTQSLTEKVAQIDELIRTATSYHESKLADIDKRLKAEAENDRQVKGHLSSLETQLVRLESAVKTSNSRSNRNDAQIQQTYGETHHAGVVVNGWHVQREPSGAKPATPNQLLLATLQNKLEAVETFVHSHEDRLNNFTLEAFVTSIVHQMQEMLPRPEAPRHELEELRARDVQRDQTMLSMQQEILALKQEKLAGAPSPQAAAAKDDQLVLESIKQNMETIQRVLNSTSATLGHLFGRINRCEEYLGLTALNASPMVSENGSSDHVRGSAQRDRLLVNGTPMATGHDDNTHRPLSSQQNSGIGKIEKLAGAFAEKLDQETSIREALSAAIVKLSDVEMPQIQQGLGKNSSAIEELHDMAVADLSKLSERVDILEDKINFRGSAAAPRGPSSPATFSVRIPSARPAVSSRQGSVRPSKQDHSKRKRAVVDDDNDEDDSNDSRQRHRQQGKAKA